MTRGFALVMIAISSVKGAAMDRGDEIFHSGLENVVAQARIIVTGPVSNFSKHVSHETSGTPLVWEIRGELRQPQVLKGEPPPPPIRFTRGEQAIFMAQPDRSPWETDYLQWQEGDRAVLFFTGADPSKGMLVYPSGSGERDLAGQVGRIVGIQSIADPEKRFEAWRSALKSAQLAAEHQVILRSLMSFRKPWNVMLPIFRLEMASEDAQTRSFVFGLVGFGIRQQQWSNAVEPADFLCERLARETDENLTVRYLGVVGLLLNFASEQDHREERRPVRERLDVCLQQVCLVGSKEIAQACKDLRASFPL
jgi:hypothetical protein